jgi:hypothetical protein
MQLENRHCMWSPPPRWLCTVVLLITMKLQVPEHTYTTVFYKTKRHSRFQVDLSTVGTSCTHMYVQACIHARANAHLKSHASLTARHGDTIANRCKQRYSGISRSPFPQVATLNGKRGGQWFRFCSTAWCSSRQLA